jgi:acetyl esterase/lipase
MVPLLNSDALAGGEALAPKEGLDIFVQEMVSTPDKNTVKLSIIRPKAQTVRMPCVIYYHGGGMSKYSCFYECWQTLARLIARQGVVVIMPEFRNSVVPSFEGAATAKFPGGLNDCVSAVHWAHAHKEDLGIDAERVIIAGESGGGNLCIATALRLKAEGTIDRIKAIYPICPYLSGVLPDDKFPSHKENAGIFLDYPDNLGQFKVTKYGEGLHEARNAFAWPGYCTTDDLAGLPPCTVVVNEFDPFRDEGVEFYRQCMQACVKVSRRL